MDVDILSCCVRWVLGLWRGGFAWVWLGGCRGDGVEFGLGGIWVWFCIGGRETGG